MTSIGTHRASLRARRRDERDAAPPSAPARPRPRRASLPGRPRPVWLVIAHRRRSGRSRRRCSRATDPIAGHAAREAAAAERRCTGSAPTRSAATCSRASSTASVHSLTGAFVAVARRPRRRHRARPGRRLGAAASSTTSSCGSSTCCCRSRPAAVAEHHHPARLRHRERRHRGGHHLDRRASPGCRAPRWCGCAAPTTSRPPSAAAAPSRACCWRHVLPNSLTSVIALAALQFGTAILAISTLGFLGYGAPPPTPEWGLLIAEGRNYIVDGLVAHHRARASWWSLVVLSANRISQSLGKVARMSDAPAVPRARGSTTSRVAYRDERRLPARRARRLASTSRPARSWRWSASPARARPPPPRR